MMEGSTVISVNAEGHRFKNLFYYPYQIFTIQTGAGLLSSLTHSNLNQRSKVIFKFHPPVKITSYTHIHCYLICPCAY